MEKEKKKKKTRQAICIWHHSFLVFFFWHMRTLVFLIVAGCILGGFPRVSEISGTNYRDIGIQQYFFEQHIEGLPLGNGIPISALQN